MGFEDSKDKIRKAFTAYVKHATAVLAEPVSLKEKMVRGSVKVAYIAPVYRLRSLVENLETSAQFKKLCSTLERALDKNGLDFSGTSYNLETFFKRSHFYTDAYDNKRRDQEELFGLFWASLHTRKVTTTRLRLVSGAWFDSKALDFGFFRIQKFTKEELDELIDRKTREVFYPKSLLDTDFMSQFWFVVEQTIAETSELKPPPVLSIVTFGSDLERNVPDRVIQLFALHDATVDWKVGPFWNKLELPFSFEVDDDILTGPNFVPEMPRDLEPLPNKSDKESWEEIFREEGLSGKELKESVEDHLDGIKFDRKKELFLKKLVKKVQSVTRVTAEVTEWNFIEIAMGYLGRAFLTEEGLDQILWHAAVLDALLGEANQVVQTISRRIGNLLRESKKDVRNQFKEVYDFRSELVHGKKYTKKAHAGHLWNARELARKSLGFLLTTSLRLTKTCVNAESPTNDIHVGMNYCQCWISTTSH